MSSTRTMGIEVTDVSTTQRLPLGFEYTEPADNTNDYGERTWIYVYNDSGSGIAANIAVMKKTAQSEYRVILASTGAPPQRIVGVAQHAVADVSYGFVLKRGVGTATADATVTADLALITDGSTAGNVSHAAAITNAGIGSTLAGRSGSGTLSVYLDCRG